MGDAGKLVSHMIPPPPIAMDPFWLYVTLAALAVSAVVACWVATLFTLPGNWAIVGIAALWAWQMPRGEYGFGFGWGTVAVLAGLAVVGEVIEFAAGAAGAKQHGGSKRGMALAIGGAGLGSILGAGAGIPVPVIGPLIGALGGGGAGAFAGAYLGETWKGRTGGDALRIGKGALFGRLLGTVGKLACGAAMAATFAVMICLPAEVAGPLDPAASEYAA